MSAQFTIPLITVIPGQLIASALWNNEWQNINTNFIPAGMDSYSDTDAQMQIQTAPFPGSVTSHASNLGGEIERIRYQLAQILGTAFWYNAPAASLAFAVNSLVPIGGVIDYPVATAPNANFLLANGQAIGRSAYAALFALIGETFGAGDASTTFNLPNYTDRMSIAAGNLYAVAATGGAVQTDLAHSHTVNSHTHTTPDTSHNHVLNTVGTETSVNTNLASALRVGIDAGQGDNSTLIAPQAGGGNTLSRKSATTNTQGSAGVSGPTSPGTDSQLSSPQSLLNPYLAMYKMIRVL